jgi:hypothetical protein
MGILQLDNNTLIIDYNIESEENPEVRLKRRFIGERI